MGHGLTRRELMRMGGLGAMALALSRYSPAMAAASRERRMNVLFIGGDDLRVELGCYGAAHMHTPNIDRMAGRGMVFTKAFVQQAVCSASRASFLTGCRPDTTTVDYPYNDYFRDQFLPAHPALHTMFHRAGYYTASLGKIHHNRVDDLTKLSEPPFVGSPQIQLYALEENRRLKAKTSQQKAAPGPPTECADVPDIGYRDGEIAQEAIRTLQRASRQDKPFYLSVGFQKPHLPFCAPKRYWDLYKRDEIPLSPNPQRPSGAPAYGPVTYEMPTYRGSLGSTGRPITEDDARLLRHGYFACVSYIDAQLGLILDELERLKLADSTIVMLWGDHGWHLGDNGCWGKHTNYERATQAPLILSMPGMKSAGQRCDRLVEYVDMFPTLCELNGLPVPDYCEGASFKTLLENPTRAWKDAVFSQYPREDGLAGYAIRTDRWRYVEWRRNSAIEARELYDHSIDPNEAVSLAADPQHAEIVNGLSRRLKNGWKAALPLKKEM